MAPSARLRHLLVRVGLIYQGHGTFGEVSAVGVLPFVAHLGQDRAGQREQGGGGGKVPRKREVPPANVVGAVLDLLVRSFQPDWSTRAAASEQLRRLIDDFATSGIFRGVRLTRSLRRSLSIGVTWQ